MSDWNANKTVYMTQSVATYLDVAPSDIAISVGAASIKVGVEVSTPNITVANTISSKFDLLFLTNQTNQTNETKSQEVIMFENSLDFANIVVESRIGGAIFVKVPLFHHRLCLPRPRLLLCRP